MKKLLFICAIMFGMSSCTPLSNTTLSPKMQNQKLLPPLTSVFDWASFFSVYPSSITTGSGSVIGSTAIMQSTTSSNPTLGDFNLIFQRDVEENICTPDVSYGKKKGTITCKMHYAGSKENLVWMIPSVLTLFIGNVFGMPVASSKPELQIEVSVFDDNNTLIGKYRSDVHKRKHYYGLYNLNKPRIHQREMFIGCMEDVKRKIVSDYERLNELLN